VILFSRYIDNHPPSCTIETVADDLLQITTRGSLGRYIADFIPEYGMYDLQLISEKLERDLRQVPVSYRNLVLPYMRERIFGRYHRVLVMNRKDRFSSLVLSLSDPVIYQSFCKMLPTGCLIPGDEYDPYPEEKAPWYHCFMYLMAAFAMYVLDEPGHPVHMPFPGGETVYRSGDHYYCPIRDKEEEIFYSICNYCPAVQTPD